MNSLVLIKHPKNTLIELLIRYGMFIPDKLYLKIIYRLKIGKKLNLTTPKTFSEKIQWLKLNYRQPYLTNLVDKVAVKKFVGEIIGDEHVIPTLGIWENLDEIDWAKLPSRFVLKTTNGGGGNGVIICYDKTKLNINNVYKKLGRSLNNDIYRSFREWPYKNVPKRIMAETLISNDQSIGINDYKFFCFNGVPKFFKIDKERFSNHYANYYDLQWNVLPYGESEFPPRHNCKEEIPSNFGQMIEIAKKLSKGLPFVRVDLYNVNGSIYFGELTFFPASGLGKWINNNSDIEIGNFLNLDSFN